jgi:hypothetical protein
MQSLIDFLGAYEPLYPQVAKGYPPEAIARLEHALGRPLPAVYRDFLATAAANLGFLTYYLTFDLDEVIELAVEKKPTLPSTFTPIAVDQSPSYADYYLDLGYPTGDGDGRIVRSAAGSMAFDDILVEYPSLHDMLFSWGFERIRMLTLPHRTWVSLEPERLGEGEDVPALDILDAILVRIGFRALGVTGPRMPLYERGDCAASVSALGGGLYMSIFLAASTAEVVNLVAEALCDNMPGRSRRKPW